MTGFRAGGGAGTLAALTRSGGHRLKNVVLVLVALALGTGCAVVVPVRTGQKPVAAKKCPPGHQWSDGKCHDTGKGHDPNKHAK